MAYGFQISSLIPGAQALLNNRPVANWNNTIAEYARKSALEISENYKFPGLQTSGPVVQLTPLQAMYAVSFFMSTSDQEDVPDINKIDSFFIYNNGYQDLETANQQNTGYNLKFKTIDNIEVLINVPGLPTAWTRHEDNIWIGCVPDLPYYLYMRYQKEHPFPNQGTGSANTDYILWPNSWQDIMEYAVAMRAARDLNLQSKANELYMALYGDAKFQSTSGVEGTPGLIFMRTPQENRDQTTSTKSLRLKMGMM
jgi:hypothetical protein